MLSVTYPGNTKFRVLMIYPGDTRRVKGTAVAPEGRHLEPLAHERRWGMSGVDLCIEFITTIMELSYSTKCKVVKRHSLAQAQVVAE